MKDYILSVRYRNGKIAQSNKPYQCRISSGEAGAMNYGFIFLPVLSWEERAIDSPVLEVKELKDNEGKLCFLEVKILGWASTVPGTIMVNSHVIWEEKDLKSGVKNNINQTKKIAVELFEKPEPLSAFSL